MIHAEPIGDDGNTTTYRAIGRVPKGKYYVADCGTGLPVVVSKLGHAVAVCQKEAMARKICKLLNAS